MKLPAMIDVFPGFRIIADSPTYPIHDTVSGKIEYFEKDGSINSIKFHLVNTLFRPDQMCVFNIPTLNTMCLAKINSHIIDLSGEKAFSIKWDASTGLAFF